MDRTIGLATLHAAPEDCRVLGRTLRPFSLWHAHLLEILENPLGAHSGIDPFAWLTESAVDDGLATVFAALAQAVAICSGGYDPHSAAWPSRQRVFWRRYYSQPVRLCDELERFWGYRTEALSFPRVANLKVDNKSTFRSRVPLWFGMATELMQFAHLDKRAAWETKIDEAHYMILAMREQRGERTALLGDVSALLAEVERAKLQQAAVAVGDEGGPA